MTPVGRPIQPGADPASATASTSSTVPVASAAASTETPVRAAAASTPSGAPLVPAPPAVPGADQPLRVWRDRLGRTHAERRPEPHGDEPRMERVPGPLERTKTLGEGRPESADRRRTEAESLARSALAQPNPLIEPDPDDPAMAVWTWVVEAPDARAALLWTNPVFDHADVGRAEFERLPGSGLWTISLRLPAALRASYRIGVWREDGPPPWRTASGRRGVLLAARDASAADPRGTDTVRGSWGEASSVAAGPAAPPELWRVTSGDGRGVSRVDDLDLPGDQRAWVYAPEADAPTPLLVLFDGQVWRDGLGLPAILDAAVAGGVLPPIHVAMLDSREQEHRWADLGVPGGQTDVVIDELLPRVRAGWNVDPRGTATIVSGQSLGGIASLWTLALSGGEVGHAVAQSPSLWRFDVTDALLDEPGWSSILLQAGTFEGDMLADARALARTLRADARIGRRTVRCEGFEAGHDWAVWRANLVSALAEVLRTPGGDTQPPSGLTGPRPDK